MIFLAVQPMVPTMEDALMPTDFATFINDDEEDDEEEL